MSHPVVAFVFLSLLLVSGNAVAQRPDAGDQTKSDPDAQDAKRSVQRPGQRPGQRPVRRGRQQPAPEVLDPEGFGKLQKEALFSGPQAGEKVTGFTATTTVEDGSESEFDPIAKFADKPLVLIFQDETGVGLRGLLGLSRVLKTVNQKSDTDVQTVVVFLGDDPNSLAKTAAKLRTYTDKDFVLAISKEGRDGPGSLGLNRNVASTILLVKEGAVKRNFPMAQAMLRPDPHVLGGIAELLGVERKKMASWFAATAGEMRMQRMKKGDAR